MAKQFESKKPITFLGLTEAGRVAIETHWPRLETLRNGSRHGEGEH